VQAVGAIGAILWSVKVARAGDKRASESERKAEARIVAADKKRAFERLKEKHNKTNEIIDNVDSLVDSLIENFKQKIFPGIDGR
jgi:hypothetical protein